VSGCSESRQSPPRSPAGRLQKLDPLEALSDVYWDKSNLERLRQIKPMQPQATLEFDDASQVEVRWR
jgi:hypothetical protein